MINLAPTLYIVKQNDSLDSIAQKNGYANWYILYKSTFNLGLRMRRPDPSKIQIGDNVYLPPKTSDVIAMLQVRNQSLNKIRSDFNLFLDNELKNFAKEFKEIETMGTNVDIAFAAGRIVASLSAMVEKGFTAIKGSTDALRAANKELTKDVVELAKDPVIEIGLSEYKDCKEIDNNVVTFMSQLTVQAYLDATSPSFWFFVGSQMANGESWKNAVQTRPKDVYLKVAKEIADKKEKFNLDIEKKLSVNNKLIEKFSKSVNQQLPINSMQPLY